MQEISNKFITALTYDNKGQLWIGTEDDGVWVLNESNNQKLTQFTTKEGMGDDNAYAIACDRLGRIWVGHLNHGVSVYNGQTWTNYSILNGPVGERVFDIATSPKNDDVWIATSIGLSRYSMKENEWTYYTRANGLPSDQIQTIAFDQNGTVYAGTQCDGLAIGTILEDHVIWRYLQSEEAMPLNWRGRGIPCNLINDICIGKNGDIYLATNLGLAIYRKGGNAWNCIRGKDFSDKHKMRFRSDVSKQPLSSDSQTKRSANLLLEDYVTCLAEDESGLLWIGHRTKGFEAFDPVNKTVLLPPDTKDNFFISRLLVAKNSPLFIGTCGNGLLRSSRNKPRRTVSSEIGATPFPETNEKYPAFPTPSKYPPMQEIALMMAKIKSCSGTFPKDTGVYLGEDWTTQGDWVGRYGRQYAVLCATDSPRNHDVAFFDLGYRIKGDIGPHLSGHDGLRHWIHWLRTDNPRTLYDPIIGYRRQAEWDDHGEAYSTSFEGPDVWVTIEVPEGIQRISFYFFNKDGHEGANRYRDFLLELKNYTTDLKKAHFAPVLAHTRVHDFWAGFTRVFS